MADAKDLGLQQISPVTLRLLRRLQADPGDCPTVWPTDELASRLGGGGPPVLARLVQALHAEGYRASASGVMPAQVRTDAELPQLLQICTSLRGKGFKWACDRFAQTMAAEIFGTAAIFWVLIPIGLAGGALLLKLQGDD